MSYLITNTGNDARAALLSQINALSGRDANGNVSLADDVSNGISFNSSLAEMLGNDADQIHKEQTELRLKKLSEKQDETAAERSKERNDAISGMLPENEQHDYSVLTARPGAEQWQVLEQQAPQESDFSLLSTLGDGLLKAAKIATAVAAFV